MDLNAIKNRLEQMNKQTSSNSGGGKSLFWKPSVGKEVVRVVPNKYDKQFPFTEMMFYYGIGQRVMASPQNWNEKDPIQEFTKQLRQSGDKDNWRLAKKLDAKTRIFAPVIVRGQENEGVKLWQFGKEVYQDFLNMASDDEIGDYTDIVEGRDIKLTTVGPEVTGTPYNKTSVGPSLKTSPLSSDESVVRSLLENQPNPLDVFKRFTFEEVKLALQDFLSDGETEVSITSGNGTSTSSTPAPPSNYSLDTNKSKSKADQFDDLFKDDKSKGDDLPF
jgi:hypothetical protein|tara:strand:- start:760 stop:1587 length:828 start_codon:yes stop_codon:yes gene_type:complete